MVFPEKDLAEFGLEKMQAEVADQGNDTVGIGTGLEVEAVSSAVPIEDGFGVQLSGFGPDGFGFAGPVGGIKEDSVTVQQVSQGVAARPLTRIGSDDSVKSPSGV